MFTGEYRHAVDGKGRLAVPARFRPQLAAGCVVLLPSRYAAAFGDAVVYCDATDVPETVRRLHADKAALRAQAARGPEFVRRHHGHEVYAERAARLATQGHPVHG